MKVGDTVRFHEKFKSPLYEDKDDLFEIIKIINSKKFYSEVGIIIKSIQCPYCKHHSQRNSYKDLSEHEFDSGWFEVVES